VIGECVAQDDLWLRREMNWVY